MPSLYVVATPIGNLEDVTLRALRILSEADLIAAEDTRVTRKLLARHGIRTPVTSYHDHNREKALPSLLSKLETGDVALVADAGSPGISDPGADLVTAAADAGHRIVPVPGPSAVTSALSVSGLRPTGSSAWDSCRESGATADGCSAPSHCRRGPSSLSRRRTGSGARSRTFTPRWATGASPYAAS